MGRAGMDDMMMTLLSVAAPLLLSAVLGWLFIPRVLILSHRKRLFDIPDFRKMHDTPVPRLGGITFLPILLICVCLIVGCWVMLGIPYKIVHLDIVFIRFVLLFVGMMMLFLVGVVDDLIGVTYKAKFLVQIVCALLFPLSGVWIHDLAGLFWINEIPACIGILLTVFAVVYVTNAINLIDGIDGLAAGICAISLSTFGLAAAVTGQCLFILFAFGMLGILLPFWVYNVYGNIQKGHKIFMGDTGSLTLGYLVSFLLISMASESGKAFPRDILIIGLSTMLLPMFDIVRVVIARMKNHHNPFLPDKNHIHHKLLRTGLSARWVMAVLIMTSLLIVLVTMLGVWLHLGSTWIFLIDLGVWLIFDYTINYFIHKNHRKIYE
ncbi:UDP-N-acetylmuramyl pentapeptide phosphotransferase/UDP-N-acetylglucosamine-1-phosphate transferase [Xylanibacter ruminicola]|uniref:UDP-N-acetylmuramyl pentapeptide phosphotransferase/UDP-N-acetylglucosamine-1-phosphate transferase n=3 Tax=Bacteroidales TaxID=171549 RepID=A0A1H5WA74_XYLRU|nr:UDP-N-acetylmuramyl pentapeptide phosphotransferase/UDP-N-acetylglucosamine-1-phosphate transferase [Xylanibacter ruminicola]SEW15578.1 UDP-N-acetylmuramyl pentapeptide phosphotransferase/UDP-N-acetylglucosamine-1-phosphate transferase [Prevotella sp. khp7]